VTWIATSTPNGTVMLPKPPIFVGGQPDCPPALVQLPPGYKWTRALPATIDARLSVGRQNGKFSRDERWDSQEAAEIWFATPCSHGGPARQDR
jgi:hypothetical protein